MLYTLALVAALPIACALLLLVGLRWKAAHAMPTCALVTVAAAVGIWQVAPVRAAAAVVEAGWITASILYIVLGALLLLAVMRRGGGLRAIEGFFAGVSRDRRLQAVIVAWALGSFVEGAAGFGTPAAITAPLLIGLGFRPVPAVVIALVGDSTAVTFGAVGTPVIVGLGEGLGEVGRAVAGSGAGEASLVLRVARRVALFDLALGTVMPVVLVLSLTVGFGRRGGGGGGGGWRAGLAAAPFAATVGLAHMSAAAAVAWTLGPEFPSLVGPVVGLGVALLLTSRGWLVPASVWEFPGDGAGGAANARPAPAGDGEERRVEVGVVPGPGGANEVAGEAGAPRGDGPEAGGPQAGGPRAGKPSAGGPDAGGPNAGGEHAGSAGVREPKDCAAAASEPGPVAPEAAPVGLGRALLPYVLLAALLALTRIRGLPLGAWLADVRVGMSDILGTGIGAALQPLYSPGAVFVLVALGAAALLRLPARELGPAVGDALRVVGRTAIPLLGAVATVRVFVHSDVNGAGLEAMPLVLAGAAAAGLGPVWPLVAPWIGALGAFVSGSATFSNMLFALFQHGVAVAAGRDPVTVLALQDVGAAAGNMVCVHNVVAACAVAGVLGREGEVIRRTAPPMAVYVVLAGLIGWLSGALLGSP